AKTARSVRQLLRLRHYSLRTEEAYLAWMKRFTLSHSKRHPRELNERDRASNAEAHTSPENSTNNS
ncbi:MAG: phage integrase N-terminal SAM-like domain-containing protein, partial [Chthoniobacterales bacterium]